MSKAIPKKHWNYRMVAEYQARHDSWFFSIRDVYYHRGKSKSWGAGPQFPIGEDSQSVIMDIELFREAVLKPLLISQGTPTVANLVEYDKPNCYNIEPEDLEKYKPKKHG